MTAKMMTTTSKKEDNIGETTTISLHTSGDNSAVYEGVVEAIKTVFDPEFPLIDIYTMGLIYDITIACSAKGDTTEQKHIPCPTKRSQESTRGEAEKDHIPNKADSPCVITISMTFTTPQCPSIDMLQHMTLFAVKNAYPDYEVKLDIVWDPIRSPAMIKDDDFKKMFWDI